MRITIHQPEHMPWLGFFHKIALAEVYVILDNVQYRRRYFQNRNKIRTKEGWQWLTVPVAKESRDALLIKDATINNAALNWKSKNIQSLYHNYHRAPYFNNYWDEFKASYEKEFLTLTDLNLSLLKFFFKALNMTKDILLASELKVSGEKGELIFNICTALRATTYVSGISGKEYLDLKQFQEADINIVFQEFHHPIYKQLYNPFIPCMSALDLLFNYGEKSLDIIKGVGVNVLEEVFM